MRSSVKAGGGEERNVTRHRVRSASRPSDRTRSISAAIASRSNDGRGMPVTPPCDVLALTVAAGASLSSATLAKPHCPVGEIYYRSKHTCLAKEVATIDRGIYHYRHHIAAEGDGTTIIHRRARARAAAPAAAIPVPPVRLAGNGTASAPARNENGDSIGSIVPPAPETARRSMSPYGALVPVTPTE